MKKIIGLCMLLGFITITYAQIRKLPAAVTNSLQARYPDARNVSWKDNLTNFQASFHSNGQAVEARFNTNGEWLETDTHFRLDELSGSVRDGIRKSKYADWRFREATEIQERDKSDVYRVLVQKSSVQKKYLIFNSDGQLLREALTL